LPFITQDSKTLRALVLANNSDDSNDITVLKLIIVNYFNYFELLPVPPGIFEVFTFFVNECISESPI